MGTRRVASVLIDWVPLGTIPTLACGQYCQREAKRKIIEHFDKLSVTVNR